jgi:hypothetical protein
MIYFFVLLLNISENLQCHFLQEFPAIIKRHKDHTQDVTSLSVPISKRHCFSFLFPRCVTRNLLFSANVWKSCGTFSEVTFQGPDGSHMVTGKPFLEDKGVRSVKVTTNL